VRALVTGGTGFVGGHLVDALLERGAAVTALARSPGRGRPLEARGAAVVHGDLGETETLRLAAAGQDVVFHVAGVVAARDRADYMRANRDGTRNLVAATERAGGDPVFVFVSSLAAAGPSAPGAPLAGEAGPGPVTAYGHSKLAAERAVRLSQLPWVVLRPPLVYGPGDRELLRAFAMARRGVTALFGDGSQELSAVYGPDLARALVDAATALPCRGGTYYPCHEERFSAGELARRIAIAVGRPGARALHVPRALARPLLTLTGAAAALRRRPSVLNRGKAAEFLAAAWTCDPRPFARDAGWRAAVDLESGLAETVRWYREQDWL
jgi:nucleoside-diphosphate-sugar epimerase